MGSVMKVVRSGRENPVEIEGERAILGKWLLQTSLDDSVCLYLSIADRLMSSSV